jgi:hypothetical protein
LLFCALHCIVYCTGCSVLGTACKAGTIGVPRLCDVCLLQLSAFYAWQCRGCPKFLQRATLFMLHVASVEQPRLQICTTSCRLMRKQAMCMRTRLLTLRIAVGHSVPGPGMLRGQHCVQRCKKLPSPRGDHNYTQNDRLEQFRTGQQLQRPDG